MSLEFAFKNTASLERSTGIKELDLIADLQIRQESEAVAISIN